MNPKEKAEDLFSTFCIYPLRKEQAIYLCLKAVDEILKANPHSNPFNTDVSSTMAYWNAVRKEIENL